MSITELRLVHDGSGYTNHVQHTWTVQDPPQEGELAYDVVLRGHIPHSATMFVWLVRMTSRPEYNDPSRAHVATWMCRHLGPVQFSAGELLVPDLTPAGLPTPFRGGFVLRRSPTTDALMQYAVAFRDLADRRQVAHEALESSLTRIFRPVFTATKAKE